MGAIHYQYTGVVNGYKLVGSTGLVGSRETGDFKAICRMGGLRIPPNLLSKSFISLSCSNMARSVNGGVSIFAVTKGRYISTRTVECFDSDSVYLGTIQALGVFSPVRELKDDVFTGDINVSGTYRGPLDLVLPGKYMMPLKSVGNYKLEGDFEINLKTESGEDIVTKHRQVFYFPDGVREELEATLFTVRYDTGDSFDTFLDIYGKQSAGTIREVRELVSDYRPSEDVFWYLQGNSSAEPLKG